MENKIYIYLKAKKTTCYKRITSPSFVVSVRQIECAINGLGARKGNADLEAVIQKVTNSENYQIDINTSLISKAPN